MNFDQQLFVDTFTQEFIDKISFDKARSLDVLIHNEHTYQLYNLNKYYHKLQNYASRATDASFKNFIDLYPPNVAILDYVIKNIDEFKGKTWLDYGCGIGMLGAYLNYLGIDFYGYDNFSQGVPKEVALDFLKKYNLENKLLDNFESIYDMGFYTISHVGIPTEIVFDNCAGLQYVFEDTHYKSINRDQLERKGFKKIDTNNLITIYKGI